jgi:hypothetical protein
MPVRRMPRANAYKVYGYNLIGVHPAVIRLTGVHFAGVHLVGLCRLVYMHFAVFIGTIYSGKFPH